MILVKKRQRKKVLWLRDKISINYVFKILIHLSHSLWIILCLAIVAYEVLEQKGNVSSKQMLMINVLTLNVLITCFLGVMD